MTLVMKDFILKALSIGGIMDEILHCQAHKVNS